MLCMLRLTSLCRHNCSQPKCCVKKFCQCQCSIAAFVHTRSLPRALAHTLEIPNFFFRLCSVKLVKFVAVAIEQMDCFYPIIVLSIGELNGVMLALAENIYDEAISRRKPDFKWRTWEWPNEN